MKQCMWQQPAAKPGRALLCIREKGHEGSHKDYTGRWDSAAEYLETEHEGYELPVATCDASQPSSTGEKKT